MIEQEDILQITDPSCALFDLTGRFGSDPPLKRIFQIVIAQGCKTVLVERQYKDREWSSEHRIFYRKLFKKYPSKTTRLHFFSSSIELKHLASLEEFQSEYIGYCTLRPLDMRKVVDAVIKPIEDLNRPAKSFIVCKEQFSVQIDVGKGQIQHLKVCGFPFMQQDTQVGCCAHAALTMIDKFLTQRRNKENSLSAKSHLTGDIARLISAVPGVERKLPTPGLLPIEISTALTRMGYCPLSYEYRKEAKSLFPSERIVYHYLESGIPIFLNIPAGVSRHALTIIGHSFEPDVWWALAQTEYYKRRPSGGEYHCSTTWIPSFIIHDDNFGPYLKVPKEFLWRMEEEDKLLIVVPLPPNVNLNGELASVIANSVITSVLTLESGHNTDPWLTILNEHHKRNDLVLRTLLMDSTEFVNTYTPLLTRAYYQNVQLPKKIWLTEISIPELFCHGRLRLGEVIIDPTSSLAISSAPFITILLPGIFISRDVNTEQIDRTSIPLTGPYRHVMR